MSRSARLTTLLNLAGSLALLTVIGSYLLFDKLAAISLYPRAVALFSALGLLGSLPLLYGHRRATQIALPALLLATLFAVQFVNWDSCKPFLRALNRVEQGMTVAQVDALMTGFMRTPTQPDTLANDATLAYRHTDAGWGDSDIGLITFVNGRVVARQFLPD